MFRRTSESALRFRVVAVYCLVTGAILVLLPLFALGFFEPSFSTPADTTLLEEITGKWLRDLLVTSLRLSVQVTIVTLVVGVPIGLIFAVRPSVWFLAGILHILPLALPPYILALGFASLTGRSGILAKVVNPEFGLWASGLFYSEAGVVLVLAIALCPIVTLLITLFARRVDSRLVDAALVADKPKAALFRVVLPLVSPGIGFAALLVFVLSLSEFAVPQLLGVRVYATAVFARMADLSFQPTVALARSVPPLIVAILVSGLLYVIDARGRSTGGLHSRQPVYLLAGFFGGFARTVFAVVVLVSVLPIGALMFNAFVGPGGGVGAIAEGIQALGNSIEYAALSCLVMFIVAVPAAWLWSKHFRVGGLVTLPLLLGFVAPAAVIGVGMIAAWNRPETQLIYTSGAIVVLGLSAKYSFLCVRAFKLGFDRSKRSSLEVARLAEPVWLLRFWKITFLGNLDAVFGGLTVGFLACFRDLDTVVLFYPPGGESLCVRAMTIEANAPPGKTAAAAALQILATIVIGAVVLSVTRGRRR